MKTIKMREQRNLVSSSIPEEQQQVPEPHRERKLAFVCKLGTYWFWPPFANVCEQRIKNERKGKFFFFSKGWSRGVIHIVQVFSLQKEVVGFFSLLLLDDDLLFSSSLILLLVFLLQKKRERREKRTWGAMKKEERPKKKKIIIIIIKKCYPKAVAGACLSQRSYTFLCFVLFAPGWFAVSQLILSLSVVCVCRMCSCYLSTRRFVRMTLD